MGKGNRDINMYAYFNRVKDIEKKKRKFEIKIEEKLLNI